MVRGSIPGARKSLLGESGATGYFLDLAELGEGDLALRYEDPAYGPGWLLLSQPTEILCATEISQVPTVLEKAQRAPIAAGFLAYEAASAFDAALVTREAEWPVLAWFGLYETPRFYRELAPVYDPISLGSLDSEIAFEEYEAAFARVKGALAAGETYQVNLTFRQRFRLDDSAARFFASRCGVRPPRYSAFLHGGEWQIASFSPELLFERCGDRVTMRPMKGTAPAPSSQEGLRAEATRMANDPKSIAENIMIVDMVRNDLGAVARAGSVSTPELLHVERHRGLLQMTSTVKAESALPTADLMRHLFPAASITGAPKVATMRIIRDLEISPRHVYCGSIGIMTPDWQCFSVAIRTALVRGSEGEFGVGSGLVWDSQATAEYQECLDKRDYLLRASDPWTLVESIPCHRITDVAYVERHLARLASQAVELRVPVDGVALRRTLSEIVPTRPEDRIKVRIAVRRNGAFEIAQVPSAFKGAALQAALATRPVSSRDPNLRLKTSSRAVLDEHLEEHPDADEVLLYNSDGCITEFCRGNVLVQIDGHLYSPFPEDGCLRGIGMSELIEAGKASYRHLTLDDLKRCVAIFLVNSVVGTVPVSLDRTS